MQIVPNLLEFHQAKFSSASFVACQIQGIFDSQIETINHIFHIPRVLIAYGDVCWDLNQPKMWTNW
jgi:hypothetical protein